MIEMKERHVSNQTSLRTSFQLIHLIIIDYHQFIIVVELLLWAASSLIGPLGFRNPLPKPNSLRIQPKYFCKNAKNEQINQPSNSEIKYYPILL